MIRLFVIDDHPIISDGLRSLLHPDIDEIEVVGNALDVKNAICNAVGNEPDIILLDLHIPNSNPQSNVQAIKNRFREKKIVIYTSEFSSHWVRAMVKSDVDAYITKDLDLPGFKAAIRKIYFGEKIFPELDSAILSSSSVKVGQFGLTVSPVQRKIIRLLSQGLTVKQIAEIVNMNRFKVNYLLKKLRKQFTVKNNVELVAEILNKKN